MVKGFGTVSAKTGNLISIIPDGSVTAIDAVDCIGVEIGDRVIIELVNNQAVAVAIVGGVHTSPPVPVAADYITEWGTTSGWTWRKWHSGRRECRKRVSIYTTSWGDWGAIKESGQYFAGASNPYPAGLFTKEPAVHGELVNTPDGAAYTMSFETGPNGTASNPPDIAVLRPVSSPAVTFVMEVSSVQEAGQ